MKLNDVAFQCCWNYTGFFSDFDFLMGKWKSGGLANIIFFSIFRHSGQIINTDAGFCLWIYGSNQGCQCFQVGVFGFFHSLSKYLSLPFCTVKIGIH